MKSVESYRNPIGYESHSELGGVTYHFFANHLMGKDVELKKIRDYLGHESIMTTERYLRERTRRQNLATIDIGNSLF